MNERLLALTMAEHATWLVSRTSLEQARIATHAAMLNDLQVLATSGGHMLELVALVNEIRSGQHGTRS